MSEKKSTTKTTKTVGGTQPGKVKGKAEVKPGTAPSSEGKGGSEAKQQELREAYEAGQAAAKSGKPAERLCPHDMGTALHHEWWRGHHDYAHPRSDGRVQDIDNGYRKDY